MQQRWLRKLLSALLLINALCVDSDFSSAQQTGSIGTRVESRLKHGNPDFLGTRLIRVREMEGLLQRAVVGPDGELSEGAIESFLQIFAWQSDVFDFDDDNGVARSVRSEAVDRLRRLSPAMQRKWSDFAGTLAQPQYVAAVASGRPVRLQQVARRFPLTEPGVSAAVLSISLQFLKGSEQNIRQQLDQLESDCRGTIHETLQRTQCESLKARLSRKPSTNPKPSTLSLASTADGKLSPPWPIPKWRWEEAIANFPDAPQPAAWKQLEPFLPELAADQGQFSNWRPVFWDGGIVMRSPFRLIAFDRLTGALKWSIPTDTFIPEPEVSSEAVADGHLRNALFYAGPDTETPVGGLAPFGILACDDEYLYFLDQFDFFRSNNPFGNVRGRRVPGNRVIMNLDDDDMQPPRRTATRLIALRKSADGGPPKVAWIAGETNEFPYQPRDPQITVPSLRAEIAKQLALSHASSGNAAKDASQPVEAERTSDVRRRRKTRVADDSADHSNGEAEPLLTDHRFLCPPVGKDRHLFVLTVSKDQYWLNCLARGDGKLLWQQPLIFNDDQPNSFSDLSDEAEKTSVCLVSGDTIVCSLSDGVLVGARSSDGQLMWATAVVDQPAFPTFNGFRVPDADIPETVESSAVSLPVADESMVACLHNRSNQVVGIDTASGEIVWQVSRQAFGPGEIGGSPDLYIAGFSRGQVILIGERHCRSLDARTGEQNWVVPIKQTSGRAECRLDRCLIPQQDGTLVTLNTQTGTILQRRPGFLPDAATQFFGAVTSDQDVLVASTPASVVVFPRTDSLFQSEPAVDATGEQDADRLMIRIQALLIDGDIAAASALLKSAAQTSSTLNQPEIAARLEQSLGELILQDWGEQIETSAATSDSATLREMLSSEDVQLLPRLKLTSEQQLRAAMLTFICRGDAELAEDDLRELAQYPEWEKSVAMTAQWSLRPDVLFNASARSPGSLDFLKLSGDRLRKYANDVVLFPSLLKSDSERERLVQRLMQLGEFAAAEAILAKWCVTSTSAVPDRVLAELRTIDIIPGLAQNDNGEPVQAEDVAVSSNEASATNAATKQSFDYDVKTYFRLPSLNARETERGLPLFCLPDWMSRRFFMVEGDASEPPVVVSVDMTDGSIRDRVVLPQGFSRNAVSVQYADNTIDTPGLMPIAGDDQLAMISCTVPGKAELLWLRRFREKLTDSWRRVEVGPWGADFFVWHSGHELHCSHPLTGQDLWSRQLNLSESKDLLRGSRRIFGDREVTVVMGTDGASFERFRTRDGKLLGSGRLAIGKLVDAEAIGRCLFYADENGRLHLFDGASGKDALENAEPVNLSLTSSHRLFQVLSEGFVVTVSSASEVILIDTRQGKIVFRTPAASYLKTNTVLGLSAFERDGRLFVGLDDEQDISQRMFRGNVKGMDVRLGFGPLLCIDPLSGHVLWNTRINSAIVPVLYGDPTDLMVAWTSRRDDTRLEREDREDTLQILLINKKTGQLVSKSEALALSRPLRFVHLADRNEIELTTRDSVVSIHPTAPESRTE